jgi:hypothetical protein
VTWKDDPLFVVSSKRNCRACGGWPAGYESWPRRKRRKHKKLVIDPCEHCRAGGYEPADLAGLWHPQPGFLVCGGPSLRRYDRELLRQRGVVAVGVNNAAAYLPCSAWTFGDPQWKFHHALHFDPKCLTFAPIAKLRRTVRAKLPDGSFRYTDQRLADCPGVFGVARSGRFDSESFLSTYYAHWGRGGKGSDAKDRPFTRLATMLIGLRLLHYLGCPRVYMLGVDFWIDNDADHGYAWGAEASGGNRAWWKIDAMLKGLAATFDRAEFRVMNCNAESKCEAFPHAPFEQAVRDCRGPVPREPLDIGDWYAHGRQKADAAKYPEPLTREQLCGVTV